MNFALFRYDFRRNGRLLLLLAALLLVLLYLTAIQYAQSTMDAFPAALQRAFLYDQNQPDIQPFLASWFYNALFTSITSCFVIILAGRLLCREVDQRTMAHLLASPSSRIRIAFTQSFFLMTSLALLCVALSLFGQYCFRSSDFDAYVWWQLNAAAFALMLCVSGYCFFLSSVLNRHKIMLLVASLLTLAFFILILLSRANDHFAILSRFSLFSVFDPVAICRGTPLWERTGALALAGLGLHFLGCACFSARNLPL